MRIQKHLSLAVIIICAFTILFFTTPFNVPVSHAQIAAESWDPVETMDAPGENWFINYDTGAARIYDATNGEMHGLVHVSPHTPTVLPNHERKEFYSTNIWYSRHTYGERTDRFLIHDFENLSPVAEVEIPQKSMINPNRQYIDILTGGKHVVSMNMTPAQSVTVVDVEKREFVGEISISGCALIMPVEDNAFLSICGDGTVMLIGIGEDGEEAYRHRSEVFFDVQADPVYDVPQRTDEGWILMTFGGVVFEVNVDDEEIEISEPWELIDLEERTEEGWWPGGGQLVAVHRELAIMYVVMHPQGDEATQYDPGNFVWVFNIETEEQVGELEFATAVENIMVTQEDEPLLIVGGANNQTHVYDALTFKKLRTIASVSGSNLTDF